MNQQTHLDLRLSQRTVLVSVDTARAALGLDAESVSAMVDSGELRWVFDVSLAADKVRELRLWARELICQESVAGLEEAEVVGQVIGTQRERLRGGEVCQLLLCSRPHLLRLARGGELEGELEGHTLWISRKSLAKFLERRLEGKSR